MDGSLFRRKSEAAARRCRPRLEALEERSLLNAATLDVFFGDHGKVLTDLGQPVQVAATAIEPDGRIVVAGTLSGIDRSDLVIARYDPSGQLDATFGNNGEVVMHVGTDPSSFDQANGIVVEPDGRIVVLATYSGIGTSEGFALVRLQATGSVDSSFGSAGVVLTAFPPPAAGFQTDATAAGIGLQADGKIVVAGTVTNTWTADGAPPPGIVTSPQFVVARYTADGSLDGTFGTGGWVATSFGLGVSAEAAALVIQADGEIVVAGTTQSTLPPPPGPGIDPFHLVATHQFAAARYTVGGSLDTSFGNGGEVTTAFPHSQASVATGVAIDSHGCIVVVGTSNGRIAVARYTTGGDLDRTFGSGGRASIDATGNRTSQAAGLLVTADDRIVVVGSSASRFSHQRRFTVVRFAANGRLDSSFGSHGSVGTAFGGEDAMAAGVALQADGKIVVAGSAMPAGSPVGSQIALVRYFGDYGSVHHPLIHSGIRGVAEVGPISPVARPGQPNAGPLAEAILSIRASDGGPELIRVRANRHGVFSIPLPPGTYQLIPLAPKPGQLFPRGEPQTIVVLASKYTRVNVQYDSGIR